MARRFPEDFGPALYAKDLAEIWGVSLKRIYALDAEGAFDFAKNRPTIGRKSWSRDRVRAYFGGTLVGLTGVRKAS